MMFAPWYSRLIAACVAVMVVLIAAAAATASSASNAAYNTCIRVRPAVGGENIFCDFYRPTTLYFVANEKPRVGGKGHRFRYILECGRYKISNIRPDNSFRMIRTNKQQRLPWDDPKVVKQFRQASLARPCHLYAYFEQYPPGLYLDAKNNFITVHIGLWTRHSHN